MIPCVLTMGKFESIHRGHQVLIASVVAEARRLQIDAVLLAFEPHPYRVLHDANYVPLLTSDIRTQIVQKLGIDRVVHFPFDEALIQLSPQAFCERLFHELHPEVIIVGEGYRFGKNREGTIETLKILAAAHNIIVQVIPTQQYDYAEKISTSYIRTLIKDGAYTSAEKLLGFPIDLVTTTLYNG